MRGARKRWGNWKLPEARAAWAAWLHTFGAEQFFDAFIRSAQGARSKCVYCRLDIYLDIVEGGGVPDWRTEDGDYGCDRSPETTEEGVGSHKPEKLSLEAFL